MSANKDPVIARMPSWLFFIVCLLSIPLGAAVLFVFGVILSIIFSMENKDSAIAMALAFALVGLLLPTIILRRMRRSLASPVVRMPSLGITADANVREVHAVVEPRSLIDLPSPKKFQLRRALIYLSFAIFIVIFVPTFFMLVHSVDSLWKPMPFEAKKTCSVLFGCSIFIQSTSSTPITINGYTANRGVCQMSAIDKRDLPKTLSFGQMWIADVTGCQVLEFSLNTDKGTWTVTWSD